MTVRFSEIRIITPLQIEHNMTPETHEAVELEGVQAQDYYSTLFNHLDRRDCFRGLQKPTIKFVAEDMANAGSVEYTDSKGQKLTSAADCGSVIDYTYN